MKYFNYITVLILIYFRLLSLSFSENLNSCEQLAGLSVEMEDINEKLSIPACLKAIKDDPDNIKYWHFLGRKGQRSYPPD